MSQTLYAGQSRDLPVQDGESIAVSCISGTYTITIIAGEGAGTAIVTDSSANAVYGPYTSIKVRLACADASSVEFEIGAAPNADIRDIPVRGITVSASRTVNTGDLDQVMDCTSGSAIAMTVPIDSTLGITSAKDRRTIAGYQGGAGALSFVADTSVTIRGTAPAAAQYSTVGLMHVGPNEWAYL